MKNKLLRAMDLIDEKYIEEADPRRAKPLKKIKRLLAARTVAAVACLCLLSMLTVTLICPFSISGASGNPVYHNQGSLFSN